MADGVRGGRRRRRGFAAPRRSRPRRRRPPGCARGRRAAAGRRRRAAGWRRLRRRHRPARRAGRGAAAARIGYRRCRGGRGVVGGGRVAARGAGHRREGAGPAHLEPDASWCEPGREPATPLANGGAFGGKESSVAPAAARGLADHLCRSVRVVLSREDVVRLGPKRPPIAASAVCDGDAVTVVGIVADGAAAGFAAAATTPYGIDVRQRWEPARVAGPPVSTQARAAGSAELAVLVEGALDEARVDRAALVADDRAAGVLLDSCASTASGAVAGARVVLDGSGTLERVAVRVAAGDPLDEVVLRSYAVGAMHMVLGWVLSEGIAVDPDTGDVHES